MEREKRAAGLFVVAFAIFFSLSACDNVAGTGPNESAPEAPGAGEQVVAPASENGNLRVLVTDAPFWFGEVDEANVWIRRVELYNEDEGIVVVWPNDDFGDDDFEPALFNLIELRDGITDQLTEVEIPAGTYRQIRVVVDDHGEVVMKNGDRYDLKVPGGSNSGIKINTNNLFIEEDELTTILLDIPLEQSFVVKGNPNTPAGIKGFNFKPVIHLKEVSRGDKWYDDYDEWEGDITLLRLGDNDHEIYLVDDEGQEYLVRMGSVDLEGITWAGLLGLTGSHEVEIRYVVREDGTRLIRKIEFEDFDDELSKTEGAVDEIGAEYLIVNGLNIKITDDTAFDGFDALADLALDDHVSVTYTVVGDERFAVEIELEDDEED